MIVDVRDQTSFKKFRIPGSVNISLPFLKVASHLKGKNVLLISEGHRYADAEEAIPRLEALGVHNVKIFDGGFVVIHGSVLEMKIVNSGVHTQQ